MQGADRPRSPPGARPARADRAMASARRRLTCSTVARGRRCGVGVGERGRQPRVPVAPDDQRRLLRARPGPRRRPPALCSSTERCSRRMARWVPWSNWSHTASTRTSGQASGAALALRSVRASHQRLTDPISSSPDAGTPQPPGDRGPLEAVEQGHGVDDRQPRDAVGVPLGEQQPDGRPPAVSDQGHLGNGEAVEELLHEQRVGRQRVVEVAGLARAPEAGQVRGQAAGELEQRRPVVRARRDAVQVEDLAAECRSAAVEDGGSGDWDRVLVDAHARPRITSRGVT